MKKLASFLLLTYVTVGFALTPAFAQTPGPVADNDSDGVHDNNTEYANQEGNKLFWNPLLVKHTESTFQLDPAHPDRIMAQSEIFGVRVNDSGDGPFNGASVHIVTVGFYGKDFNRKKRSYESWTDKGWGQSNLGSQRTGRLAHPVLQGD